MIKHSEQPSQPLTDYSLLRNALNRIDNSENAIKNLNKKVDDLTIEVNDQNTYQWRDSIELVNMNRFPGRLTYPC